MKKILFLTWDGPQTNYLEGLFIPIFKELKKYGYEFSIIQFSWAASDHTEHIKSFCTSSGIKYECMRVLRYGGMLGGLTTILLHRHKIQKHILQWNIDTILFRNLMSATALLSLNLPSDYGLIFDSDGLPADERADFRGLSRKSITYRYLRLVEKKAVKLADRVLVRSPNAIEILAKRASVSAEKFSTVVNGRDAAKYNSASGHVRTDNEFRVCYVGSLGPQYLPSKMLQIAIMLKSSFPNLVFNIYTGDIDYLNELLEIHGLSSANWISVRWLNPSDLPQALSECDLAFALRSKAISSLGVSPIKLADYSLAGLPIIGNDVSGSGKSLVDEGYMLDVDEDFDNILTWLQNILLIERASLKKAIVSIGLKEYSLEAAVMSYLDAFKIKK